MEKILKQLLDELAAVADSGHEEIFDTDVREQMFEALFLGFVLSKPGYRLPAKFGMFSDEGNAQIKYALEKFVDEASLYTAENNITNPQARLELIQNDEIVGGSEEFRHDDFFGYLDNVKDYL